MPSTEPSITAEEAVSKAEKLLNSQVNDVPLTIQFVAQQDGSLALTHVMQIQNDTTGTFVRAYIDAHSGDLVHMSDFITKSTVGIMNFQWARHSC